jgi:hypothetical protein
MDSSPGFVSTPCHSCALFRLAFAMAPAVAALTWRQRVTRWFILQKARRHTLRPRHPRRGPISGPRAHPPEGEEPRPSDVQRRHSAPTACRHTVSGSNFTSLTGDLFTFPSRYLYAIGRQVVFSLGRWSSLLPTGFLVSRGTQGHRQESGLLSPTGLSPSMVSLSCRIRLAASFVTPLGS